MSRVTFSTQSLPNRDEQHNPGTPSARQRAAALKHPWVHGTEVGAQRHRRHREALCDACRDAWNDASSARRRRRSAAREAQAAADSANGVVAS